MRGSRTRNHQSLAYATFAKETKPGCKDSFEVMAIFLIERADPLRALALAMYHGFMGETKSRVQIAEALGVSVTRVDQILASSRRWLRNPARVRHFANHFEPTLSFGSPWIPQPVQEALDPKVLEETALRYRARIEEYEQREAAP
jgi:hypothetical protein